jgi:monooxygenase
MSAQHVDVIIVGAGLSGIGAAYRLSEQCPTKTYEILESRDAIGGTWDLFKYPGIRSDSDMYTLSFPFSPWKNEKSIAAGGDIRQYIQDSADRFGITPHIRFGHQVQTASWSSEDARWTVTCQVGDETVVRTASFLYLCSGYYSYKTGFTPEFPGIENFKGQVVHPQFWPEELDYKGKEVVVIGSGATAVTLIPSMADDVSHITMLQRSPTYITTLPDVDKVGNVLRKTLPDDLAHRIIRRKNATVAIGFYVFCRRFPKLASKMLLARAKRQLPGGTDMRHFTPRYNPWDQRLCIVPNGDLFRTIRKGKASIVTDTIKEFTADGIALDSGQTLKADVVVTATGLQVVAMGEIAIDVDGRKIDPHDLFVYKGLMFSGVPNFAWCVGYTNASWTLRADLSSQYVCKLINRLDELGQDYGMPDPAGAGSDTAPILDLNSGYVTRVADQLPLQGTKSPWTIRQNWLLDSRDMKKTDVDEAMVFGRAKVPAKS